VYIDGGNKMENSVDGREKIPFKEGTTISFRPESKSDDRDSPFMVNAEFQIIKVNTVPSAATVIALRLPENNPSNDSNNSKTILDANDQRHVMEGFCSKVALPQTTQSNSSWSRVRNLEIHLYVGNLSFDTTVAKIRRIFEEFGMVSDCFIPTDRDSGRVCGYALVTMPAAEAEIACNKVNGQEVDRLTVAHCGRSFVFPQPLEIIVIAVDLVPNTQNNL
jgi:hypothetical protein